MRREDLVQMLNDLMPEIAEYRQIETGTSGDEEDLARMIAEMSTNNEHRVDRFWARSGSSGLTLEAFANELMSQSNEYFSSGRQSETKQG